MAYFLPFGAGLIALHTISILFVSRISLIKRLFLVVWVMLFAIGAPFLFQQVPGIAFVGLCALSLAVYMVLLFSQELAPVKKRGSAFVDLLARHDPDRIIIDEPLAAGVER